VNKSICQSTTSIVTPIKPRDDIFADRNVQWDLNKIIRILNMLISVCNQLLCWLFYVNTLHMLVFRSAVLTAVSMNSTIFWDMMPCRPVLHQRLRQRYYPNLQGPSICELSKHLLSGCLAYSSTLKIVSVLSRVWVTIDWVTRFIDLLYTHVLWLHFTYHCHKEISVLSPLRPPLAVVW
jgi:hypothetical protein